MIVQVNTDIENPKIKRPAHQGDAGYDLIADSEPKIFGTPKGKSKSIFKEIFYIEYDTSVKIAPDDSMYSYIFPRSSISKHNLALANSVGVIDTGYRDSIKLRFKYIAQPSDYIIEEGKLFLEVNKEKIYSKGEKIAQLIWAIHHHPHIEFNSNLPISDRMIGGFGSTGA